MEWYTIGKKHNNVPPAIFRRHCLTGKYNSWCGESGYWVDDKEYASEEEYLEAVKLYKIKMVVG